MSARRRSQLMRLANLLNDETDDEYVPSAGESDVDAESELEEDDEEEEDEMERATALSEPTRADASSKQESAGALETGDCNAKPLTCARPPGSPVPLSVSQSERHPQSEPEPEPKRQPGPNSSAELLADEHLSVALRTRSKQPLTDVSIADLERNLPLLDADVELEPLSCLSSSAALLSVPPAPASPFTVPLSDALVQASPSSSTSSWQPLDTPRKGHSHPSGFTLGDLSALLDDPSLICPNPNPNPFSDCGALEADALLCASPGTSTDEEREWRQFLAELRVDSAVADAVAGATYADLFQTATNPLQYLNTPVPLPVSSPAPTPVSESHNARNANAKDNVERPNLKSTGGVAEEDEERADPSFNVLDAIADMDALDDDLREELRSDRGTRVSKRELNELLAEYYALTQGDQENANAGAYPLTTATTTAAAVVVPPPPPPDWGHSESPLLRQIVQTPNAVPPSVSSIAPSAFPPASAVAANNDQNGSNSHLCRVIEDEQLVSPSSSQCNSADPADSSETREDVLSEDATTFEAPLHFGDEELQLLRDQMVMHVQLLAQLGLLAGAVPACEPLAYAARFYLQELQLAARNQRSMLALTSSLFDACNLEAACALLLDNSASASSSSTASDTDAFSSSSSRALAPAPETAQAVSNSYNGLSGATLRTLVTNAAFPCAELLPLRAPFYTDTPSPSAPAAASPTTSAETSAESSNRASREPRLRSFSAGEDRLLLLHVHHCRLTKQRCRWATFRRAMLPYRTLPQIQQRLGRLLKDSAQERQKRMLQLERSSPVPRAFTCADIPCPVRWYSH